MFKVRYLLARSRSETNSSGSTVGSGIGYRGNSFVTNRVSAINHTKAVFRIRIRLDPAFNLGTDSHSESEFRIQMSKKMFKKPKFTMSNSIYNLLASRTKKMLRLS